MLDQPLLVSRLNEFADRHHGDTESYRGDRGQCPPLSDRFATLAWNGYAHGSLVPADFSEYKDAWHHVA
jgi:hypothetical protein